MSNIITEHSLLAARRPLGRDVSFARAVALAVAGQARAGGIDVAGRGLFPENRHAHLLCRAAVSAAGLSSSEWAAVLASESVANFVGGLTGHSAAASLFQLGLRVDTGRAASVKIPGILASSVVAGFVPEHGAIPVIDAVVGAADLRPAKIAVITSFTRELAQSSGIAAVVEQVLSEAVAIALDGALFSSAPAGDDTPAGLLNGATSITPASGGGETAMLQDIASLIAAVSDVANGNVALVLAPRQFAAYRLRFNPSPFPAFASRTLAPGTAVAIAAPALAAAISPVPEIDTAGAATLHYDTAPDDLIAQSGDPNTISAPVRSLYQTDTIAVRASISAAWGLRAAPSAAAATVSSATW